MPFFKEILLPNNTSVYLWKIDEEIFDLKQHLFLTEISSNRLAKMKSESHIKGFLAVRQLLNTINYIDSDLYYDSFGKPLLKNGKNISISHSHEFACLIISDVNVGIDIELKSEKILKNIPLLFNEDFIFNTKENKEDAITLTTFGWAIKEALFKLIPENNISFRDNIYIRPFQVNENLCIANVEINNKKTSYTIHLETIENYVLAYVIE